MDLEKTEEPEIDLLTSTGLYKNQGDSKKKKKSTSASLSMLKPLTVWITTNWKLHKEMGIIDDLNFSQETCIQNKKQQ